MVAQIKRVKKRASFS